MSDIDYQGSQVVQSVKDELDRITTEMKQLATGAATVREPREGVNGLAVPAQLNIERRFAFVSHDRYFMDRLVNHLFVMEGEGFVRDFPGNYSQFRVWEKEQSRPAPSEIPAQELSPKTREKKRQLTFKERRELETLEKELENLAAEKKEIFEKLHGADTDYDELQQLSFRIGEVESLLDQKELRWLELSELLES